MLTETAIATWTVLPWKEEIQQLEGRTTSGPDTTTRGKTRRNSGSNTSTTRSAILEQKLVRHSTDYDRRRLKKEIGWLSMIVVWTINIQRYGSLRKGGSGLNKIIIMFITCIRQDSNPVPPHRQTPNLTIVLTFPYLIYIRPLLKGKSWIFRARENLFKR